MTNTSIDFVRGLLRDRQVKAGARGTITEFVCLDVELLEDREILQSELAILEGQQAADRQSAAEAAPKTARRRLSDPAPVDDELEDEPAIVAAREALEEKDAQIRAASLRLVFHSLSSTGYQDVVNRHPEGDDNSTGRADFYNDVDSSCLKEVWTLAGERIDELTWDEIRVSLSYGEWEQVSLRVSALNRRKVDVPFSLRSSEATRA